LSTVPHLGTRLHAGLELLTAECGDARLVFSTRAGGVSRGPYAELNLGLSVGDDQAVVLRNRELLCRALALSVDDLVVSGQVHGTHVAVVGEAERGRGARARHSVIEGTDGLVTVARRVALVASFADCVPVFVAGETSSAAPAIIGLVHAGWRGMLAGVVREMVQAVAARGAARVAVIGPSIGPCCFVTADDIAQRFVRRFGSAVVRRADDGAHVDLWRCAAIDLQAGGLAPAAIVNSRLCTSCDQRFFSHRRDHGLTGRQVAIAWLADDGHATEGSTS
jgi:polyphenol oxidase